MLRKHSLFDKTKAIVSKEERVLLISFTTLNKVGDCQKNATVNLCEDCFDFIWSFTPLVTLRKSRPDEPVDLELFTNFERFTPENHGTTLIKWRYFIVTCSTVYFCISGRVLSVAESRVVWIGEEPLARKSCFDFRGSSVRVFFPIFFDFSPYFSHLFSVLCLRLVCNRLCILRNDIFKANGNR